jgi:hypothetical protein
LIHRLAAPLIQHVLEQFRTRQLCATTAAQRLGLSARRLYELFHDDLKAYAHRQHARWTPRASGGPPAPVWPQAVTDLLRKRLGSKPPASSSFAASEALRLCGFKLHRAQVRRWALANQLAPAAPVPRSKAPVRRWQRSPIGELGQLDASPHRWFAAVPVVFPMLNMLDDCSRVFVGSKLYHRELLLAYCDFLPEAFAEYGLPLELYLDYHSLFFTAVPEALTQLGAALRFYGISLRYAPTPQAKGKVEREHQFWQQRLPAYFASEGITELTPANHHLRELRWHRNQHQVHRELGMTPQRAWDRAHREGHSVVRPVPRCPWWPYVWSQRTVLKVGSDGRVSVGGHAVRVGVGPATRVILCHHPSGHHTVLAHPPQPGTKPVVLFTNRSR